ncbi:MAG TPA: hypothetical protein VF666_21115 [Pyrinomonadaceae bacterium]
MRIQKRLLLTLSIVFALQATSVGVFAQEKEKSKARQERERSIVVEQERIHVNGQTFERPLPPHLPGGIGHGEDTFIFLSTEMSFGGKVVKGAPYSAEAVTEFTQTLADGNRIVRKNSATVYRDSEGRTRRDQTLGSIGPFAVAGDPSQTFFINDPVAKVNYILDPRTRTARKLPLPPGEHRLPFRIGTGSNDSPAKRDVKVRVMPPPPNGAPGVHALPPPPPPGADVVGGMRVTVDDDLNSDADDHAADIAVVEGGAATFEKIPFRKPQKESLGKRTIEGVEAEGTRITHTIAAGEIGNEQPINIVAESWYSPELQTVVLSKNSDPRVGENVYRLTNINRSEPARTLFEVPSDYTVREIPMGRAVIVDRKKTDKNDK